eukprot:TRINITY_DN47529_c0_g1_i1.p1 TRINITY_DN47529_c0_g1~~TRINITY_DN47529_c0_g1_i1.p1  ORF type:complete len:1580 (+),score=407.30 TRINITY_DN47529_c0_g1_i1:42-4781(+)
MAGRWLLLGLLLRPALAAQEYWCSSTTKYTPLQNPCTPLPCNGTSISGGGCGHTGTGLNIGDRVLRIESGTPGVNARGTVVCLGSAGDTLLVLWDNLEDIDDQWDGACGGSITISVTRGTATEVVGWTLDNDLRISNIEHGKPISNAFSGKGVRPNSKVLTVNGVAVTNQAGVDAALAAAGTNFDITLSGDGYDGCSSIRWCDAATCAQHTTTLAPNWLVSHAPLPTQRQGHTWWVKCDSVRPLCSEVADPTNQDPECGAVMTNPNVANANSGQGTGVGSPAGSGGSVAHGVSGANNVGPGNNAGSSVWVPVTPPQPLAATGYGIVAPGVDVAVTQGESTGTPAVGTLTAGTVVHVDQISGNRARITAPVSGWVDINGTTGGWGTDMQILAYTQPQPTSISNVWSDTAATAPRRYPPRNPDCASGVDPSAAFETRAGYPMPVLAVQVVYDAYAGTVGDAQSTALSPQMRCTATAENATLDGTTTVLTESGCAVFDALTVGDTPYYEATDKVVVTVQCASVSPTLVGAVLNVTSVATGYITVKFPNTATATFPAPALLPPGELNLAPHTTWADSTSWIIGGAVCGWVGGGGGGGTAHTWKWVCTAVTPADTPLADQNYGHAPVSPAFDFPPIGHWGGTDDCARPTGPGGTSPCKFDCVTSDWSKWSECNATCGANGTRRRYRTVVETERYGGNPCSALALTEHTPCNRHGCESLCPLTVEGVGSAAGSDTAHTGTAGQYGQQDANTLGSCSAPFSTIRSTQMYLDGLTSVRPAYFEGCAALQPSIISEAIFLFEGHFVNVEVGDAIQVTIKGASVGSSCNLIYYRPCVRILAYVGKFGAGPWEPCGAFDHTDNLGVQYDGGATASVSCSSPFRTQRFFVRLVPEAVASPGTEGAGAITGGQEWAHGAGVRAEDQRPDGTRFGGTFGSAQYATVFLQRLVVDLPCVRDCVLGDWGPWGNCSAPCDGGWQTRERVIVSDPTTGGLECEETAERRECNDHHCDVDCAVTGWSAWGQCTVSCGTGERASTRTISKHAAGGGTPCPTQLVRYEACNTDPCGNDCQVSAWTPWSPCTATCGGGFRRRIRAVLKNASIGGDPCPALEATENCNTDACTAPAAPAAAPVLPDPPVAAPGLSPLEKFLATAPVSPPVSAPVFVQSPADGLPTFSLSIVPRPVADGSTMPVETLGMPMTAAVAALDASGEAALGTLPNDTRAFVTVRLVDDRGSPPASAPLRLAGDTRLALTPDGTAAFVNLQVDGDVAGPTLVDVAYGVDLWTVGDDVEVSDEGLDTSTDWARGTVTAVSPALLVSTATGAPREWRGVRRCCGAAAGGNADDSGRTPEHVRRITVLPRNQTAASEARLLFSHWGAPVDSFNVETWRSTVATAVAVNTVEVDVLSVQPAYRPPSAAPRGTPTGTCVATLATGQGTGVVFRFTSADAVAAEQRFLRAALDPSSALGRPWPPLCGVAEAFSATASDPRFGPYLQRSLRTPAPTPLPTPNPTPAPESVDWTSFFIVLAPVLLLIWSLAALAVWCVRRRLRRKRKAEGSPAGSEQQQESPQLLGRPSSPVNPIAETFRDRGASV